MPSPWFGVRKPVPLAFSLVIWLAGILLQSSHPAMALPPQQHRLSEPNPVSQNKPSLDSESRVALALWLKSELDSAPVQAGSTSTVPGRESAWMEYENLRGNIPDACFGERPGVQLAAAESVWPPWNQPAEPISGPGYRQDSGHPAPHAMPMVPAPGHSPAIHSPAPHSVGGTGVPAVRSPEGVDPHFEVFTKSQYPSAAECATCHQQIYDEWASSSHAYASISPMFHAFENTITRLSQGTVGYFCLRCHAPVATAMGVDRTTPIFAGPQVFREGVTCVACHRVKYPYVKSSGERRIEPGSINAPVFGSSDGTGSSVAVKYRDFFKVKTDPRDSSPAQPIHQRSIQFEELTAATFCMSCHQVAVQPGIKLEVVWDQYRASPACREGVSCQDCHMGRVPGRNEGYSVGPAAVVNNLVVNPERKHSNHLFYGPGYSIAHPGVFPFENQPERWSFAQWQEFDWRSGWGTEAFEQQVATAPAGAGFPPAWQNVDDRMDAREKIDRNLQRLAVKKDLRRQVLENGSRVDGPCFTQQPCADRPLRFEYVVTNTNPGHNLPSGSLGAQPQVWVNVVLTGPDGNRLWESGHLDSWGDLADQHSVDVVQGDLPLDRQLVNFQTKFLTSNVKGTDREMPLPVNVDFDQLPFLRPPAQPTSVINHPPTIRMEAHSLPPNGSRTCRYTVPAHCLDGPGTYRLTVRLRSRAEPMYFMRFCNATPEMIRMMQEWTVDFHVQSVVFEVDP